MKNTLNMRTQQLLRLVLPFAAAFSAVKASEQLVFREGGSVEGKEAFEMPSNERPSLGDLLTVDRSLSIFYDYLRQSSSLVSKATQTPCWANVDTKADAPPA